MEIDLVERKLLDQLFQQQCRAEGKTLTDAERAEIELSITDIILALRIWRDARRATRFRSAGHVDSETESRSSQQS